MMMTSRNDVKDRLIHNQSPYPTKDKVLSYNIPVDHSETLLLCSSSSSSGSGSSSVGANSSQDSGSLSFITSDDDPCNGRDSLASFLDEGLGTSLDGVDEIASPIFPSLGRNDSGVFSSDEGAGGGVGGTTTRVIATTPIVPPPRPSKFNSTSSSASSGGSIVSANSSGASIAEVVSWKALSSNNGTGVTSPTTSTNGTSGSILLSPSRATATISVVTDAVTGLPSIICTPTLTTSSSNTSVPPPPPTVKLETPKNTKNQVNKVAGGKTNTSTQQPRSKSMPLGRQGPQKCTICDKVFSNASALTKHKLTHSDERRHACATCGKAFKRQDHLNGHMLTHRNKKPFECKSKGCGKSYCDARSLRRHVENRHGHEVLESMNLTSHKHGNKVSHHHNGKNSNSNHNRQESEPQPELTQVAPVKVEPADSPNSIGSPKVLDCMPVLQPEPQLPKPSNTNNASHNGREKTSGGGGNVSKKGTSILLSSPGHGGVPPPPVLQKVGDNALTAHVLTSSSSLPGGVPIVLKRENVSVFDFDENMEDDSGPNATFTSCPIISSSPSTTQPEKLQTSAIKVSNIIDSSKLGPFADIRLIQEWTKRLGDSKVALFLASSSSAASSIAQFSSPMTLDGQSVGNGGMVTMSGTSHGFIPTNENGLFSVTPISIVPTSSGEFAFKPTTLSSVPSTTSKESPKPIYILPPEPLWSTGVCPPTVSTSVAQTNVTSSKSENTLQTSTSEGITKESKHKNETAKEKKSAIGATLANRIKTKLKGNMKKQGKNSESKNVNASTKAPTQQNQSPPPVLTDDRGKSNILLPQLQLPPGMPTATLAAPGTASGIVTWCPTQPEQLINGAMEDEEGIAGEGEDKPVECSICCRRFKNTPALNGHMRLHGGYFKKETEGTTTTSKKKESTKEHNHNSTPLQTASVSVRALIEEKIKERRNNLLKLAAAAAAEKAAAGGGGENGTQAIAEALPQQQPTSSTVQNSKSKSEKVSHKSSTSSGENKASHISSAFAQQAQRQQLQQQPPPCIKLSMDNIKLKMEPTSSTEKDKNCDHNNQEQHVNFISSFNVNNPNGNNIISTNHNNNHNLAAATVSLDSSFQDLGILLGGDVSGNLIGLGGGFVNGSGTSQNDMVLPHLVRETVHHHPQPQLQQQTISGNSSNGSSLPVTPMMEKTTMLDCGLSPEEICQAFHLIYVDGIGAVTGGNSNLLSFSDQDSFGKVSKIFQEPLPEISTLMGNTHSTLKNVTEPIIVCQPNNQDDSCNLPWEWRNSTSSENTDNSLSNVQDCVNSLLCSTSSDMPDESSTKDPVAGGGFCYTPILSPNSSFCLTPGPDSPFEACAPPNQSLSFICPYPSIGTGSSYSDPSMSSLVNPPSSVEPIFSPDQSQPPSINSQPVNITPTAELQKYSQSLQPELSQNPIFINSYDGLHQTINNCKSQGIITMSQVAPISVPVPIPQQQQQQQPQQFFTNVNSLHINENRTMDCLPSINNSFPTMQINGTHVITCNGANNFLGPKDIILHCPTNNNTINIQQSQQNYMPAFEIFSPLPLPKKVADKWLNGKVDKGKKIHVGSEYQADIPSFKGTKAYRNMDEKLWDPCILEMCSSDEVDTFLEFACCSDVPGGGMNKEYALHLLTFSKGNIREALLRLMEKLPTLPAKIRCYSYAENQRWTSEEIMAFQIALIQIGKDFAKVAKAVGTKSGKECVCFYYFWKKVCPSEYQVMKQIWRERLEHQKQMQQSQQQQQNFNTNTSISSNNIISYFGYGNNTFTTSNNRNVSFIVPSQEFKSK